MIAAFQKFAANAPDFPVYAKFDGHEHETLGGSTCLGWYHSEDEAEAVAERARNSVGCRKAVVVPKCWLIPAFAAVILLYDRRARGEKFEYSPVAQEIIDEHGTWPFALSLVLIEPVIEAVREERLRQHAAKRAKAKHRLSIQKPATTCPEVRPC